jgi:hypothetical protein
VLLLLDAWGTKAVANLAHDGACTSSVVNHRGCAEDVVGAKKYVVNNIYYAVLKK